MSITEIQSEAFDRAALQSEKYRIVGLLGMLGVLLIVAIVRGLIDGPEFSALIIQIGILIIGMMVYEGLMYMAVDRTIKQGQELPEWVWKVNFLIETLFPTLLILLIIIKSPGQHFQALLAPSGLLYFFFIILSTLRLSPTLARLTGAYSALGYMAITIFTFIAYPNSEVNVRYGFESYATYAIFLLMGGFIAGAVAAEVRKHLNAALNEAREVERMSHDLNIARSIQQGLLPETPPTIEGYAVAGWNQPADQTGGDYFDWQTLPNGKLAISLADVSGHGIGPALVTAVTRAYSRAMIRSIEDLGEEMARINQLLVDDLPSDRFVTFVVAMLDPDSANVELLSAGHGPILLYTAADDKVQDFGAHGIPFGLMSGFGYGPSQQVSLAPGDMIVLMTDGFFEWANAEDEEYGVEPIQEIVRANSTLPPDEIIAKMYEGVKTFVGDKVQDDDLTAVILKRERTA